jgi:membrane-associated phospholipid phosphatase
MEPGARSSRISRIAFAIALLAATRSAAAQETGGETPIPLDSTTQRAATPGILGALTSEAKLYLNDGAALVTAPLHWSAEDRKLAAGVVLVIGGLMAFDTKLANESQEHRSSATNSLSTATTDLGAAGAWVISGGLVVGGLALNDSHLSTTGREALESGVLSGLIVTILKPVFGRERPPAANNEVAFEPGSKNYSFPSGHATEAFTVASVIAARSSGWLIPTLAYAGATAVAFDRVNDRAHFPSDVVAGAALGIAVGRFVVHRHERASESTGPDISLTTLPHGAGVVAHF